MPDSAPIADLRRLLERLSEASSVEDLAALALPELAAAVGACAATMWLLDDDDGVLRVVGSWSSSADTEPYVSWCRTAAATRGTDPLREAIESREQRWTPASAGDTLRTGVFEACGLVSSLVVPLAAGGVSTGAVELATRYEGASPSAVEVVGIVAAVVAQRVRLTSIESTLEATDALRRAMFESLVDAFVATDRAGVITLFNAAAEQMFALGRDEVIGRPVDDVIVPPSFRPFHRECIAHVDERASGRMLGHRRRLAALRSDGTQFPVDIAVIEVHLRDSTAFGAFLRDASAEANVERALVESGQRFAEQARELQRNLLPASIPSIDGLDLAIRYVPAGVDADIGGDFYDLFPIATGGWALAVGDVQGKGLQAAAVMALARFAIRGLAARRSRPAAILAALNEVLVADQTNRSCTLVYGRLTARDWGFELDVALAGHPQPMLVNGGRVSTVGQHGLLLGVKSTIHPVEQRIRLVPGDVLLLYTDGLTEARSPSGEFLGEQRVSDALAEWHQLDAETIAQRLERMALQFQGYDARDDIALVVVKVVGSGRA